jgi:hypothetical protein
MGEGEEQWIKNMKILGSEKRKLHLFSCLAQTLGKYSIISVNYWKKLTV